MTNHSQEVVLVDTQADFVKADQGQFSLQSKQHKILHVSQSDPHDYDYPAYGLKQKSTYMMTLWSYNPKEQKDQALGEIKLSYNNNLGSWEIVYKRQLLQSITPVVSDSVTINQIKGQRYDYGQLQVVNIEVS
ncbi:hypothetical protein [Cysteiniphilum marinum]|uniref:hypothetical protein n=1 Tax=Cysteiniphilum marinum TaxID=2774191 RepID=UPI00193BF056|nr:hypothetical protein [Cysteiniphilum marinum]